MRQPSFERYDAQPKAEHDGPVFGQQTRQHHQRDPCPIRPFRILVLLQLVFRHAGPAILKKQ
jgi:hypothetical protein